MDFKKCERCGCFFLSEDSVCFNCKPKDKADSAKLLTYLESKNSISSIEEISLNTGISSKNITRYLEGKTSIFSIKPEDINNISINL